MSLSEDAEESKLTSGQRTGAPVNRRAVCGGCNRVYRDPKILPCLHTFCSDCIGRLEPFSVCARGREGPERGGSGGSGGSGDAVDGHRAGVTVLCPHCDSEVDLPASGPAGLSTDHLALDQVFLEALRAGGPLGCDLCGEGGAESRCDVCCVNLCGFCCQAHRRQKRTACHSVQRLEELKSCGRLRRPILCSLHPGQELRLFCPPCDRPVCLECAATLHRDHGCRPARDAAERHGGRIREVVAASLRPRMERLKDALLQVDVSQDALQARVDATANEVRAFARAYASAVEAHCRSLLQRLEELRVQHRNQLHLQRAQLQQALLDVGGGVEFAERLLSCGSDAEILAAKGVTLRRLTGLLEAGYDTRPAGAAPDDAGAGIGFVAGEPAGEVDGYPLVGVVNATTLDLSRCTIEGEGVRRCVQGQRGHFTLVCRDSAGERVERGGEPVLVSVVHKEAKNWSSRRHGGTFHCCSFCSSGGAKEARCGCTGTMPGGFKGCGHSHRGHPGKPHWSCCGSTAEQSECLPPSVMRAVSPRGHLRTVEL
ncbi:Tripartite motif-containing protein 45 [Liparis tanakae]|uniref:Tripartite motif-containing protein 45 n=1 Tax=Liparis tanakae TaxID=230148 RepID=A0A4Z2F4D1_9TELE|nr:Tripartite motif-containing protein 45 [Liparis tanakae]